MCSEESDSILIEAPLSKKAYQGALHCLEMKLLIRFFAEIKENSLHEADNLAFRTLSQF